MFQSLVARRSLASNIFASRSIRAFSNANLLTQFASEPSEIQASTIGYSYLLTLNRPKALNSLTLDMVRNIYSKLQQAERLSCVYTCIMRGFSGSGPKVFSAGGDIKALYDEKVENTGGKLRKEFFKEEYRLNHLIASMKTNYISIIDGLTMGGGVGLSVHGRFRVATERTALSMPEVSIGFFPDVGSSFFLSKLDNEVGMYLALTGSQLNGEETVHAGMATHFVSHKDISCLVDRLTEVEYDRESIDWAIRERSSFDKEKPSMFVAALPVIKECFSKGSVEEILQALKAHTSDFAAKAADDIRRMCPLSVKIAFKQLRLGQRMSLEQCFQMEYRISQHLMNHSDFYEGVYKALKAKDRTPKWKHDSIEEVTEEEVQKMFAPVSKELLLKQL